MTITQIIDVPADRRIILPPEIPVGSRAQVQVKILPLVKKEEKPVKRKMTDEEEKEFYKKHGKRLAKELQFFQDLQDEHLNYDDWYDHSEE